MCLRSSDLNKNFLNYSHFSDHLQLYAFFTESAHWADSVMELPCPSVCDNSKHSLPGVLETFGRRGYCYIGVR